MSEGKCRPVLIIQNQTLLDIQHPSTLIIPLTTKLVANAEPLRIRINPKGGLEKKSDLLIDQLRAIDNKRLIDGPIMRCDDELMEVIYEAICEVMQIQ